MKTWVWLGVWLAGAWGVGAAVPRPDILLIAVDDLRPELGCYGAARVRTPHLDRLAAGLLRFDAAYCQQAVCLPSRISLFTGMRPDRTGVHDLQAKFRQTIPGAVTLTQHLGAAGYHTVGMGKLYHDEQWGEWDDWVDMNAVPGVAEYHLDDLVAELERLGREAREQGLTGKDLRQYVKGPAVEAADRPDRAYHDGAMTDLAIERLRSMPEDRPFFMAVGYRKPHLPFVAPKRYWDLYPADGIAPAANAAPPRGAPPIALSNWGELRAYRDMPEEGPVSPEQAVELVRGYYACVSFVDAQVGRLLDALEAAGRADRTVVVLWGDHGWKLGEHGMWCKHTNFELDTRVPLIIRAPGAGRAAGASTGALVELIDLYPTLCELAGVPAPAACEGRSLVPLLADPGAAWADAAFSQYKRPRRTGDIVGYSMKVAEGRYTEWIELATGARHAVEFYDHGADPGENVNAFDTLAPDRAAAYAERLRAHRAGRP